MRLGQGGRGRQRQAGGSTREDARKRGHGSTVNTLVVVVKNFTIISAAPLLADVELSSQRDRSGDASVKMLVACGSVVVLGDEGFRGKHPEGPPLVRTGWIAVLGPGHGGNETVDPAANGGGGLRHRAGSHLGWKTTTVDKITW